MWPLFYLPWALTVQSPALGLISTTAFVAWHYITKASQMQKVELTIKSVPGKIIEHYVQPHKESKGAPEPCKGESKVGSDDESPAKRCDQEGQTQEKEVKKSPYVWKYAQWGAGQ